MSSTPSLPRRLLLPRLALAGAWAMVAFAGAAPLFVPPAVATSEFGVYVAYAWGSISAIAAAAAAVGSLLNSYRIEWVAAWFAASGMSVYTLMLWWLVFSGAARFLTQAFLSTAVIMFMVSRALAGAARAAKLRAAHLDTGGVNVQS